MKKEQLHLVTLIFGSIVAFAITFSQFIASEFPTSGKEVSTEQTENSTQKEAYISLPSFSLPAPVHVQANLDPYCLFEIFFEEDTDEDQEEENLLHPDRFFQTMFRVIISPNAP